MPRKSSILSFAVRDEQLLISRRGAVSHRIRIWPRPYAEKRKKTDRWERFYPEFRVIDYPLPKPKKKPPSPQLDLGFEIESTPVDTRPSKRQAYDQLRQTMPRSYAMALAPFKSHQWDMIVFLSFHRRFYELIKANPAIAFSLANLQDIKWRVYRKELRLEDLTGMKQTELLKLLGLPATKSFVQLTKKIQPASVSPDLLKVLRQCLHHESVMKRLSHLKKINAGVLALLTRRDDVRALVTPQLLEEVSLDRAHNHYPASMHQLTESFRWHRELHADRRFPLFRTLDALNTYHEEMVAEGTRLIEAANREAQQRAGPQRSAKPNLALSAPFPRPPLEETRTIRAVETAGGLRIEGSTQHNCVGGYFSRVHAGSCYIYRVLEPERATLSIVRGSGGPWRIGELEAAHNRTVRDETRRAVEEWLGYSQLGI